MNKTNKKFITPFLIVLFFITILFSARYGAVNIRLQEITSAFQNCLSNDSNQSLNERIFLDIRLPRALLCVFVGASLSVGGILMQGLFRNPIVEPGLVGTSSGAAFGAALYFVLGATFKFNTNEWTLPIIACLGAVLSTTLVFVLSKSNESENKSVVVLLLTGIAINALFMSGVGFLSYIARDPQARSITFWGMGTLSGANWHAVAIVGFTCLTGVLLSLRVAKHLNTLMMGEEEAVFLGVNITQMKWLILAINVVMIATATAFVGVISFVGLIVPHLLRLVNGSDNRTLIINGAIAGAIFLCLTDLLARLIVCPAELPIGIVTSLVGVPVLIYLLRRKKYYF